MKTNYIRMKIGQLGILSRGVTYSPPEDLRSESDSTSIWLLRSTNLQGGEINLDDVTIVAAHCAKPNQRLANGDIAICTANGSKALVGKASLVCLPNPSQYVVGAFCARMRPNDGESPEFLAALFESGFYKSWIGRLLAGTNINNLKPSDIASCSIRMPSSLAQRNRLGEIFSLSRLQIKTLDRLIAAKREQKRGLMQQLLTGKLRFPGFTEPWKTVRLEEVVSLRNSKAVASEAPDLHCIELEHIEQGTGELIGRARAGSTVSLKTEFASGDVLFGKLRPYLKKFALVDFAGFCSTEIWAITANRIAITSAYLRLLVESPAIQRAANATSGTKMPRADWDVVAATAVKLPSIVEQERITALTSTIEAELRLLNAQRAAFAAQRRGLMEKLLSGEIDIQNPKETAA